MLSFGLKSGASVLGDTLGDIAVYSLSTKCLDGSGMFLAYLGLKAVLIGALSWSFVRRKISVSKWACSHFDLRLIHLGAEV